MVAAATPEIFVSSEFFAKEPQRRAAEAMRRDHEQYMELFSKAPEERSEDELRAVGAIIADAPWFAMNFAPLRSKGTTKVEQARDLARTMVLVTYEPLGGEPPCLCTKGEPVESFDVIVHGSVQVTDDPLVMTDVAGSGARVLHGGQWFGTEALVPPDPFNAGLANASSSNVRSTGVKLTLLRLLRTEHIQLLAVQKTREHELYADLLSSLPMLKHYSCRARTELAAAFSHARFGDGDVIVENAATSKAFFVLMRGSVKVRKTLHVAAGLSYPIDLKVLHEGDIFGGDRFSTRMPVFDNLSFVSQGAIECMQLSSDHRLLDGRARQLVLEEFISLPDETLLLEAFDQQSGWEQEKTQVLKHEFKRAVDRPSRGSSASAAAFARPLSRDTFTRSSVYIPSGAISQHGEYRPSISWRHGRNGKHMAETASQFAQRHALVSSTRQDWQDRLSKCPGSRESIRSRRVVTVPLAKSSAEIYAETFMPDAETARPASVGLGEPKRPPRPITPNDFGAGWLADAPAASGREKSMGLKSQQSIDTVDTDATFAGFVGEDPIAIHEMWPDRTSSRRHSRTSHTSWGVRAMAAAAGMDGGTAAGNMDELPPPEVKEGFDRLFLRRLVDATVQATKKSKQTRSTQYYPQLSVLVADVVDSSGLQDCGPELSEVLDSIFTQFKELAEGRYNSSAMWGKGRRFIALSGVQHNTDSSCIGSTDGAEAIESDPGDNAIKAASWKERSFEASASFLEARFKTALEAENQNASNMPDKPTNLALDRLIQLAGCMQRCVAHANSAPNATKNLSVRIGIATGPAVVGFYGLQQPFPYNCWGWTVDEARRLERAASSGSILLETSAHEAASNAFSFEPQAAVGAIRGGDMAHADFDYRLLESDAENAAGESSYRSIEAPKRKHTRSEPNATPDIAATRPSNGVEIADRANSDNSGRPESTGGMDKENHSVRQNENGHEEGGKKNHWSRRPGCRTRMPLKVQASVGRIRSLESSSSVNLRGGATATRSTGASSSSVGQHRRQSGSWLPPAIVHSSESSESLTTFAGEMFGRVEQRRSGGGRS